MMAALTQEAAPAPARSFSLKTHERTLVSAAAVVVFLIAWQLLPALGLVDVRYTSQPSTVFKTAINIVMNDNLGHHAYVSFMEFLVGFALAVAIGIPAGILFGTVRILRQIA